MALRDKKLGLIGVGNMGTAILEGLLRRELVQAGRVFVFDKYTDKAEAFASRYGLGLASSNAEIAHLSDVILLAIKPQDLFTVSAEFRSDLGPHQTVISILAGMTLGKLKEALGDKSALVRAMPNLGAKVGESLTALDGPAEPSVALAEEVFSGCGRTVRLQEKLFDVFTALAGSGPAYFFFLMETIQAKAIEQGFSPEAARLTALQTALGASLLASSASESPAELRAMVTSKGGTTEAALQVLENNKARDLFSAAYDAAAERGRTLRGG